MYFIQLKELLEKLEQSLKAKDTERRQYKDKHGIMVSRLIYFNSYNYLISFFCAPPPRLKKSVRQPCEINPRRSRKVK